MSYWLVSTPLKFLEHNKHGTCEIKGGKTICMVKYIHSQQYTFYLEFLAYKYNKYSAFCNTKAALFSIAYEDLLNCMQCSYHFTDQVINW